LTSDLPSTVVKSKASEPLIIQSELEDSEPGDEFYDALARGESFEDEDSDDDDDDDDDDDATTPKVNTTVANQDCEIQIAYYVQQQMKTYFLL
jgi:hypothetical protein